MYISASKQFDKIIVWEQRTDRTDLNIRTFNAPYQCYVRIGDWKNCRSSLKQAVDDGDIESATVLKNFLGSGKAFIDTATTYLSMYNEPLYKLKFKTMKEMKAFTGNTPVNVRLYESDIPPELKVLSANYYQAELPILNVTFYDIEVDYDPQRGFSSTMDPYAPISSIAFYHQWLDEYVIFSIPPKALIGKDIDKLFNWSLFDDIESKYTVKFFQTEGELLAASVEEIQQSDVISGWNSALFDDPYFAQRVQIVLGDEWFKMLSFPKGKPPYFREVEIMFRIQKQVQFDGRITVDYLELFKKFTVEDRDSWNLESVSADHLGERFKKMDYEGTLNDLYNGKGRVKLNTVTNDSKMDDLKKAKVRRELVRQELERRGLKVPE
jgi:DNA polymerase elongation subunit (family B)